MSTHRRVRDHRHPLPDLARARRVGRDEPRPRLLGGLRRDPHRRRATGSRGTRFVFTIGRGNDVAGRRHRRARAATCSAATSRRSSTTWARPRASSSHDSQLRWLGPEKGVMHMAIGAVVNALWDLARQARRAAAVAATSPAEPRGDRRRSSTSATSPTPSRPTRRSQILPRRRARPRRARSRSCSRTGYPAYTTTPGLARLLRREARAALPRGRRRRLPADQAQGRRRPRRRPCAGCGIAREAVRTRLPDRDRREPALGRVGRDRVGERARRVRASRGSRSRRAPTTSSATPRSRAASPRSGSRPASTCRTASSSSSCCRRAASTSCRSTPRASAASTRTSRTCCSPRSSACRSARTPAASACARRCSTSRCSTTSPSRARWTAA